jgi:hypothetical protein
VLFIIPNKKTAGMTGQQKFDSKSLFAKEESGDIEAEERTAAEGSRSKGESLQIREEGEGETPESKEKSRICSSSSDMLLWVSKLVALHCEGKQLLLGSLTLRAR